MLSPVSFFHVFLGIPYSPGIVKEMFIINDNIILQAMLFLLLLIISLSLKAYGQTVSQCVFNGSGGATNAMVYYHCLTDFAHFYALNYPFGQVANCIWSNLPYALANGYRDIHLTTLKSYLGDIHVTFTNTLTTFHCYADDNNCFLSAKSDTDCVSPDVKKLFSNVCNSFFVQCERTLEQIEAIQKAALKAQETKMVKDVKTVIEDVKEML